MWVASIAEPSLKRFIFAELGMRWRCDWARAGGASPLRMNPESLYPL